MKFIGIGAILALGANALPYDISARAPNAATCGTQLTGNFEFPHLLVPVNSAAPDSALGTSFNGQVSSTVSSIFNFDIPQGGDLKMCSLVFLWPSTAQQPLNTYTFRGDGKVKFGRLEAPATLSTTFKNAPKVHEELGTFTMQPGNSYSILDFPCPMGEKVAFQMSNAGTTVLDYFQKYGDGAFGLFITRCRGQ